jgi:hypothetical protein
LRELRNPHNDTVLNNAFERDQLFLSSLKDGFNSKNVNRTEAGNVGDADLTGSPKLEKLDISLYADLE